MALPGHPFQKTVGTGDATPALVGDKLYVFTRQGDNEVIRCLNAADGQEVWKDEYAAQAVEGAAARHPGPRSSPAVADGKVVTLGVAGVLSCLDAASGKVVWRLPFPPERRAYNSATPIIDGQIVIYMGAARGSRAVEIEKQGDAFTTNEVWNNPDIAPQFSTPVLNNGLLFGLSNKGNLFCLNAQTGQVAWIDETVLDRGGFAAMLDTGSAILALPGSGELVVFKPTEAEYAEVARVKVADTPTYAHPVLAGKRIFVKDAESLALCMVE